MTVASSTGEWPFLQRQDCLKQSSLVKTGLGLEGGRRTRSAVASAQKRLKSGSFRALTAGRRHLLVFNGKTVHSACTMGSSFQWLWPSLRGTRAAVSFFQLFFVFFFFNSGLRRQWWLIHSLGTREGFRSEIPGDAVRAGGMQVLSVP